MLKRVKNITGIFHMLIIASFFLSGCGYKADPYYDDTKQYNDNNVEFIQKSGDENSSESCK
jgi:hypothetical protein